MKRFIFALALIVGLSACAKKNDPRMTDEARLKLAVPGPAAGRAEFVSPIALLPDPSNYHGKRVILAGVWTAGFEHSKLDLENSAQDFWIWVDADWSKIDGPMGDFSHRKEKEEASLDRNGHVSHRIVAEGTFYYRKTDFKADVYGYGHMGVADGYFIIDRLFQFDPKKTEPNQSSQRNAMAWPISVFESRSSRG